MLPLTDSNRGPIDCKSIALPSELQECLIVKAVFSLKAQYENYFIRRVNEDYEKSKKGVRGFWICPLNSG